MLQRLIDELWDAWHYLVWRVKYGKQAAADVFAEGEKW